MKAQRDFQRPWNENWKTVRCALLCWSECLNLKGWWITIYSRSKRYSTKVHKRYSRIKYTSRIAVGDTSSGGMYFCQYRRIKIRQKRRIYFRQIQTSKLEHCFCSYPVRIIWYGQRVGKDQKHRKVVEEMYVITQQRKSTRDQKDQEDPKLKTCLIQEEICFWLFLLFFSILKICLMLPMLSCLLDLLAAKLASDATQALLTCQTLSRSRRQHRPWMHKTNKTISRMACCVSNIVSYLVTCLHCYLILMITISYITYMHV